MAEEFDFETIDITGLTNLEKVDLVQMFAQLRTLANKGLIIVMSGENSAHPNVTDNPRYANYIWIDSQDPENPVIKVYAPLTAGSDQYSDWIQASLVDGSVTVDKIAQFAVTLFTLNGSKRIALKYDQTADNTKSNFLVRVDAAGQYIEVVSAAAVVNGIPINLSQLSNAGAVANYVITFDGTVAKWAAIDISGSIGAGSLALSKLANAGASNYGWLLRANPATGVIELVSNSDKAAVSDLLAIRSLRLNRLDDTAAANYDKIRFDGTNWVRYTPFFGAATSGGPQVPTSNGGGQVLAPHALGIAPRNFKCILICNSADLNYAVGDRVDASSLFSQNAGNTEMGAAVTVYADATNVVANFFDAGAANRYLLVNDTTFARNGNIDVTKWDVYFQADL